MKKTLTVIIGLAVLMTGGLFAQSSKDVTMTVTLKAWYDLSIGLSTVTFTDIQPAVSAAPGTQAIAANEGAVSVRAFAVTNGSDNLKLNVAAATDLTAGTVTIPVGAITWTASGDAGYKAGTMAKTSVEAGSWTGSILHWHEGTFSFSFLRNYTTQAPGAYSATATYTLSVI